MLDAGYREYMLSEQGELLPPICWLEALGIEPTSVRRWAVEHLRGLIEAYHHEDAGMGDGEMVLVCAVDMFMAGLGLGLGIG